VTALLVLMAVLATGPPAADAGFMMEFPGDQANASYVGRQACLDCHDDLGDGYWQSMHSAVREFEVGRGNPLGCESCHGPGSGHVDSGEAADIFNPAKADPSVAARVCLQCHAEHSYQQFEGSVHALSDVRCSDCHDVHGWPQRTALLEKSGPSLCYECHRDVESQTYLPSHHPIKEGQMGCTDCHDPHSNRFQQVMAGERTTDLCFSCHAKYEGPWVFEHAPVVEDCGICHAPHGAVANNLLKQNEPFLCLQCHQTHFHATLEGIEGEFTTLDGNTGVSTHDGSKRAMLTKCTQCHSQVHGSDLPSQSVSGEGGNLTR
jgi:DmsE family decaheme c-type cytochrome